MFGLSTAQRLQFAEEEITALWQALHAQADDFALLLDHLGLELVNEPARVVLRERDADDDLEELVFDIEDAGKGKRK